MPKTILFSPVGGSDPISKHHDGALLHICRIYHPDIVYLYMSKEILDYKKADDRYVYCLNKLMELDQFEMDIHEIPRPELVNVHRFDNFYDDFEKILNDLRNQYPKDDILINITSATPAMKSCLMVLATLEELDVKAIQVDTPSKAMNSKGFDRSEPPYDVKKEWLEDEDNRPEGFENRSSVEHCPTLYRIKYEQIIGNLLTSYDYAAALEVARTLPAHQTVVYLPLLEMASRRQLLDTQGAMDILRAHPLDADIFPVKDERYIDAFEYMLDLEIKQRQGKYADFIRALSPLIVDLFWLILEDHFGITQDKYCSRVKNKNQDQIEWDRHKMAGTEVDQIFTQYYQVRKKQFKYGPVYSTALMILIRAKSKDKELRALVKKIRTIEQKVRNQTAHEIVSITDAQIVEKTGGPKNGMTSADIVAKLKEAFGYTNMALSGVGWDAYDTMNAALIKKIDGTKR